MVEHIAPFARGLVISIALIGKMVGCRIIVVQTDCFVGMQTHNAGGVVVAIMVVIGWHHALRWWILAYVSGLSSYLRS